jgi:hypothetical protein
MKLPSQAKPVIRVRLPVRQSIGLGDLLKGATRRIGINPCQGCEKRAAALNLWMTFTPLDGRNS